MINADLLIDRKGNIFSVERADKPWYAIYYRDKYYLSIGNSVMDILRIDYLSPFKVSEYVGGGHDKEDDWCPTDRDDLVRVLLNPEGPFQFVEDLVTVINNKTSMHSELLVYCPKDEFDNVVSFLRENGLVKHETRLRLSDLL